MTTTRKAISLAAEAAGRKESVWGVFLVFLRLGLTSFGGPIAHLGYFRDEFVNRRRWLSERSYADLVALCQFLPGPASSQVGMALGLSRHGYRGAFAAWAGFTLPSAVALILFARGLDSHAEIGSGQQPGRHGLGPLASRLPWRICRMGWIHTAFGCRAYTLRARPG